MTNDVTIALRRLRKSPGFAMTAVLTLALSIGANAIVFSVLNALILRPIDVPHAENLYLVQRSGNPSHSYPDYRDLRQRNRTFEDLVNFRISGQVGVKYGEAATTAWPYMASGNYFDALGIQPYLGRFFHASDEKGSNSAPYVVLNYSYWRAHFQGDPSVIGKVVELDKHPFTIIGVAPPSFRGTVMFFSPALWVPIVEQPLLEGWDGLQERGNNSEFVIGRLKPGVSTIQATQDLNAVGAWLAKTYPTDEEGVKYSLARPGLVGDVLGGPAEAFVAGLMLLAGLILLAACANLGSLFAARAADRAKETAMRLALGSRRGLIMRQILTEAVVVSLAGGITGLAGGVVILRLLSAWQPIPDIPINIPVNPDVWTYAVALVLALVSALLFGMIPVRQVMQANPWQVIRAGTSGSSGMRRFSVRDVLLAVQIAICAVLVTSSLVAVRGLARSMHSDFGFVPRNAVLVESDLGMGGYRSSLVPSMQRRMLDAARTIPGAQAAGMIDQLPLSVGSSDNYVYADSVTDFRPTNLAADSMNYRVSPGYFAAAGTRLLAGRDLTLQDDEKAPFVAVVNHQFALKVFGSVEKAIGNHYKYNGGTRTLVVGVVEDGKYRTLTEDQQPAMFTPFAQHQSSSSFLVVRSERSAEEIAGALDRTMRSLDPTMPFTIRTWNQEMSWALFAARVASVALGVLGLLGAMLAVTGIFGMASYTVSKRLRELGIRMALGAQRKQVLRAALGRAFTLLVVGSGAGVVLGVLASKVLAYIVYQAAPRDPIVLGGVVLTMLVLGLAAAWVPAQRALAVNPMMLMREE